MDINMQKRNEVLAQNVIKGLESRNMSGYYAADREAAVKQALELIPEGSSIAMGGCTSAHEIGLIKALEDGNYNYINRAKMSPRESLMAAYDADVFLSSANAITSDGVMVNIDGNSNRVSCIAQGPKKVVFIVGMNKVCSDLDAATKEELEYGSGLMELLKQPLYHPLSLHEKVITLCAATHKVLLGVEKTKIKQFQYDMLQMFEAEHPEIGQEIEEKKVLTEELIDKIVETAKEFKKSRC